MSNKTTFEYLHRSVHTEDGWIHPLRDAVAGVSVEEALFKPAAEVASIWEIVAHAAPYIYDVVRALRSDERQAHEDWLSVPDPSAAAWNRVRDELLAGIDALGAEIAKLADSDFLVAPAGRETPRWEVLVDLAVHDAYHAGQIVKLKQIYAAVAKKEATSI